MALSASDATVSPRPVIGLTTYLQQAQTGVWDVHASFLPDTYLQGVVRAGGIATLLPPQPVDADIAARVLDGIDLVFPQRHRASPLIKLISAKYQSPTTSRIQFQHRTCHGVRETLAWMSQTSE